MISILILILACTPVEKSMPQDTEEESPYETDEADPQTRETPSDTAMSDTGDSEPPPDTGRAEQPLDDASILDSDFPTEVACGGTASASVTLRNTGRATWTRDSGYKLGTVGDEDPFHESTRVYLPPDVGVAPGETHTFGFELQAPQQAGVFTTDWQMVHEAVHWFGGVKEHTVVVTCSSEPPAPDLGSVTWLHTDVSGWAQTGTLSSVTFSGNNICLNYDKANQWPIYNLNGSDVVGNPWIFIYQNGQWYAGTWEWLRPGQTCKAASSVAGDHIKTAPFDAASGWTPQSGEVYYFMVSGLARFSERNVSERTNLVRMVWP